MLRFLRWLFGAVIGIIGFLILLLVPMVAAIDSIDKSEKLLTAAIIVLISVPFFYTAKGLCSPRSTQLPAAMPTKKATEQSNGCVGCLSILLIAFVIAAVINHNGEQASDGVAGSATEGATERSSSPPLPPIVNPQELNQPSETVAPRDVFQPPVLTPTGLIKPKIVIAALERTGFSKVGWRESKLKDGEWISYPPGHMIEFGPSSGGKFGLPTNLSLFVYGSGPEKVDRVTIKLNVNNDKTAREGKRRLLKVIEELHTTLGAGIPRALATAVNSAPIRFQATAGDQKNKVLWKAAIPNALSSLELEQSRITALVFTIRANDATTALE